MKNPFFNALVCSLILCGILNATASASGFQISASILPQSYFVERLAGQRMKVSVMIPKSASPETYEPTPQQMVALSDSKLYIKVGAPGFPFEEKYLNSILKANREISVVDMSHGLKFRKDDPHVWTSPSAVRISLQNIYKALIRCDPSFKDQYERNLKAFLGDINLLDREIRRSLSGKEGYFFMVYHPAWGYFADEYGLRQLVIEEEGKPMSASHIRKMVDLARSKDIRAIIVQKGFDTKSARAIARDIGARIIEADPLERNWLSGIKTFTAILTDIVKK